jgi:Icc-related predicted phosphoesterase
MKQEIKIVAFSDTHGHHRSVKVPYGDVLVFAGDLMTSGRKFSEVIDFGEWFMGQPHEHKILVAGNHDIMFEHSLSTCLAQFTKYPGNFHYLQDSGVNICGWNFWGSPYQPWFCNWAFNKYRGPDIKQHWDKIPLDTDFLITHGPPIGYGDYCNPMPKYGFKGERVGCADLMDRIREVRPIACFFGHIHNGRGMYISTDQEPDLLSREDGWPIALHNVSICNEEYQPDGNCHTAWYAERE